MESTSQSPCIKTTKQIGRGAAKPVAQIILNHAVGNVLKLRLVISYLKDFTGFDRVCRTHGEGCG
uniref:Uncharacterized protein n=1 Tax=Cucumis melo TaxID=3656 RepID=A0A9I9E5C3_CUCME